MRLYQRTRTKKKKKNPSRVATLKEVSENFHDEHLFTVSENGHYH